MEKILFTIVLFLIAFSTVLIFIVIIDIIRMNRNGFKRTPTYRLKIKPAIDMRTVRTELRKYDESLHVCKWEYCYGCFDDHGFAIDLVSAVSFESTQTIYIEFFIYPDTDMNIFFKEVKK